MRLMELELKLTRPAKANGGDRYEHGSKGDAGYMVIYVPQESSRKTGQPFPVIKMIIEVP